MQARSTEELRLVLVKLLHEQTELLHARVLGFATDAEILDYELREEVIRDLCNRLARSSAA